MGDVVGDVVLGLGASGAWCTATVGQGDVFSLIVSKMRGDQEDIFCWPPFYYRLFGSITFTFT
jgi:hypothetical protein